MHSKSWSRQHRPSSPPASSTVLNTPVASSRSSHARSHSPPSTYHSQTASPIGNSQKLNVVTRVAIEGKVKQDQDGASIKLYLKIALPLDNISPSQAVPLFPEGNIKVLTSQVHPLDHNSAPYSFSSSSCPLLHKAARALNLPARTSETYTSLFAHTGTSTHALSRSSSVKSSKQRSADPSPLDEKFTGQVLVSQYNVTYVLPREFPPKAKNPDDNDEDGYLSQLNPSMTPRDRRKSMNERRVLQFMAAIDLWVPYYTRPPRSPYSLCIPTPRCLHNHIRLRIFTPSTVASSFASLSSAEDEGTGAWDMMCEPHVTRSATSRLSRTTSYTNFADDESSDSSTVAGFSEGCGVQGTFPSTEVVKVRWAKPIKTMDMPGSGDGRRRVGVRQSTGEMSCTILGKATNPSESNTDNIEGVVMNVEYHGKCTGVWFSGVATQLGMDIGLEAKGSDVYWAPDSPAQWDVTGGVGCTGWDVGVSSSRSRPSSIVSDTGNLLFSASEEPTRPRYDSASSSSSSLLRAPLPVPNVAEYSFEGSASAMSGTISSPGTDPAGSLYLTGASLGRGNTKAPESPGAPITLHVDMDDLSPPNNLPQKAFTFTITGTVLVVPRHPAARQKSSRPYLNQETSSSGEGEPSQDTGPIVLPRFTVLVAESESTSFTLRNDISEGLADVEVYNTLGDVQNSQTRKMLLKPGGTTKCGDDGGRIALRFLQLPISRPNGKLSHHPNSLTPVQTMSALPSGPHIIVPETLAMIPWVNASVIPLFQDGKDIWASYAVRLTLPIAINGGSEWLELGIPQSNSMDDGKVVPEMEIVSASVDGVAVPFETVDSSDGKEDGRASSKLVKLHISAGVGIGILDYIIKPTNDKNEVTGPPLTINLPFLYSPVGMYKITIEPTSGLNFHSTRSNFRHRHQSSEGLSFIQHSIEGQFIPRISFSLLTGRTTSREPYVLLRKCLRLIYKLMPILLFLALIFPLLYLAAEVHLMKLSMQSCSGFTDNNQWAEPSTTYFVTTTVTSTPTQHGWFAEKSARSPPQSSSKPKDTQLTPTPTIDVRNTSPSHIPIAISTTLSTSPIIPTETQAVPAIWRPPFPWQLKFELEPLGQTVLHGLEIFWNICRKVYHYPLDPP